MRYKYNIKVKVRGNVGSLKKCMYCRYHIKLESIRINKYLNTSYKRILTSFSDVFLTVGFFVTYFISVPYSYTLLFLSHKRVGSECLISFAI